MEVKEWALIHRAYGAVALEPEETAAAALAPKAAAALEPEETAATLEPEETAALALAPEAAAASALEPEETAAEQLRWHRQRRHRHWKRQQQH